MSSDGEQSWKRRERRTRRRRGCRKRGGASARAKREADSRLEEERALEAVHPRQQDEHVGLTVLSEEVDELALVAEFSCYSEAAPSDLQEECEDEEVEHAIVAELPSRPEQDEVEDQEEQATNAQEETELPHLASTLQAMMLGLEQLGSTFSMYPDFHP